MKCISPTTWSIAPKYSAFNFKQGITFAMLSAATDLATCFGAMPAVAADDAPHAVMNAQHRTLLRDYCQKCHGAEKQKGKFRVDDLPFTITTLESAERWQKVLNQMNSGDMPPADEKQPDGAA